MYFAEQVLTLLDILKLYNSRKSSPASGTRVSRRIESTELVPSCRIESAATRSEPPELESAAGWSQLQLVSSRRNLSQPWDGVSRNLYLAAATRVSCRIESARTQVGRRIESAVTCIQPLGLETAPTYIQPPELELAAG